MPGQFMGFALHGYYLPIVKWAITLPSIMTLPAVSVALLTLNLGRRQDSCTIAAMTTFDLNTPLNLNTQRILITGGAGFIGSWLIRTLLQRYPNATITNLDALTYAGNLANLDDVADNPNYSFVHGDIMDAATVNSLMANTDICVNVAAQTHVDRSISGPGVFTETNVMGTQVLLEAARQHNIAKYVQVSTDEVYGSIKTGEFTENSPIKPNSPYSASKAGADMLVQSYHKTYGFNACITRCSNNYGPYQYPEKLIPLMIAKASNDESLPVYGDGLNVRDWIHVEDHVAGIIRTIEAGQPGEAYNFGASHELANIDLVKQLLTALNKPESLITYVTDRPGHDRRYAIDSSKAQQQLGWQPQHTFSTGLQQTIDWYLANPQWVAAIQQRCAEHQQQLEQGVHATKTPAGV